MTEREFCYWLQGLFEVGKPEALNAEQTEMIRKHLALVFTNVTAKPSLMPTYLPPDPNRIDGARPLDWWNRQPQCGDPLRPVAIC